MQLAAIILVPVLLAGIFFISMVYPIWALVHCARSTALSQTEKTVWIIVLVLSWSLGALIYGFVTKEKGPFKVITWINAFIAVGITVAIFWGLSALLGSLPRMNEQHSAQLSFHLEKADTSELTAEQRADVGAMLSAFQADSKSGSVFHLKRLTDISAMLAYLAHLIEDKRLSAEEYADLRDYYRAYKNGRLDSQTLNAWSKKNGDR